MHEYRDFEIKLRQLNYRNTTSCWSLTQEYNKTNSNKEYTKVYKVLKNLN